MALGQALSIRSDNHWHMREHWQRCIQGIEYVYLARGVIDVIIAANNMGNTHVDIINHYGKVVGRRAVTAGYYEIIQFFISDTDAPTHQILKYHRTFQGIAKADDGLDPRPGWVDFISAFMVVARFNILRALFFSHGIQLFGRTETVIGQPLFQKSVEHFAVAIHPIRLEDRPIIIIEPNPAQTLENGINRSLGGALTVGIFHPQDELPAMMACIKPAEKSRTNPTDV
jgi:hypothetical protein